MRSPRCIRTRSCSSKSTSRKSARVCGLSALPTSKWPRYGWRCSIGAHITIVDGAQKLSLPLVTWATIRPVHEDLKVAYKDAEMIVNQARNGEGVAVTLADEQCATYAQGLVNLGFLVLLGNVPVARSPAPGTTFDPTAHVMTAYCRKQFAHAPQGTRLVVAATGMPGLAGIPAEVFVVVRQ